MEEDKPFVYKYNNPIEQGYIKIKLSKEEHKNIFGRSRGHGTKYEYYENENFFMLHRFIRTWVKVANILMYPVLLLIHGVGNIKELNSDIGNLFNEKQGGHFYSDWKRKDRLLEKGIKFVDHFEEDK